jgi:cytochrome c oxidase assembly protein subunit 11
MDAVAQARPWRLLAWLALVPVGMLVLALVAFPPFYSLWCRLTGTGLDNSGLPADAAAALAAGPTGRPVETFFVGQVFDNLPVSFGPVTTSVTIRPGETGRTVYRFANRSDRAVRFRPVHAVAPVQAANRFLMMECFCFQDQEIEAGGEREWPVSFTYDQRLDPRLPTVTVSYSLFRIDPDASPSTEMLRIRSQVESQGGIISPPLHGSAR